MHSFKGLLLTMAGGAALSGCLLIPTPGPAGSGCSVETDDEGQTVIVCEDGTREVLSFSSAGDAGPVPDGDDEDASEVTGDDAGAAMDCANVADILDGGIDPCGRFVIDGGVSGLIGVE